MADTWTPEDEEELTLLKQKASLLAQQANGQPTQAPTSQGPNDWKTVSGVGKNILNVAADPLSSAYNTLYADPLAAEASRDAVAKEPWGNIATEAAITGIQTAIPFTRLGPLFTSLSKAKPFIGPAIENVTSWATGPLLREGAEEIGIRPEQDDLFRNALELGVGELAGRVPQAIDTLRGVPRRVKDFIFAENETAPFAATVGNLPKSGTDMNAERALRLEEARRWAADSHVLEGGKFNAEDGKFYGGSSEPLDLETNPAALRLRMEGIRNEIDAGMKMKAEGMQKIHENFLRTYNPQAQIPGQPPPVQVAVSPKELAMGSFYHGPKGEPVRLPGMLDILEGIQKKYGRKLTEAQYDNAIGEILVAAKDLTTYVKENARNGILGLTPAQLQQFIDDLRIRRKALGDFDYSQDVAAKVNPSKVFDKKVRLETLQEMSAVYREWLGISLDRVEIAAGLNLMPPGFTAKQLKNVNNLVHHGIEIANASGANMMESSIAATVSNASNLVDRTSGRVRIGWGGLGGAAFLSPRAILEGIGLAAEPGAMERGGADVLLRADAFNAAMRLLDIDRGVITLPSRMNSLLGRAGSRLVGYEAADGLNEMLRGGLPNITTHQSLPRHVPALESIPLEVKADLLLMTTGPLDGPALIQQMMSAKQPREKAMFWSAVAKQIPMYPFAAPTTTGLPSEFDDGTGTKLWDDSDKVTWADTIQASPLREDIKAQLTSALFRDGTVYSLQNAGELAELPKPSPQQANEDMMIKQIARARRDPQTNAKRDLING